MERRASEPEELEDLFRIDHLTTRMRRHSEGLIILSGDVARPWLAPPGAVRRRAAGRRRRGRGLHPDQGHHRDPRGAHRPGRGRRHPPDRGARGERDDLLPAQHPGPDPRRHRRPGIRRRDRGPRARHRATRSWPRSTSNLAHPPQFDLSGSDQLGLFVAGQLARRHDIRITLQGSPYGGTTAIVLIPTALVVNEGAYDAAGRRRLPEGERPLRLPGRQSALSAHRGGDDRAGPAKRADLGRRAAARAAERPAVPPGDGPGGPPAGLPASHADLPSRRAAGPQARPGCRPPTEPSRPPRPPSPTVCSRRAAVRPVRPPAARPVRAASRAPGASPISPFTFGNEQSSSRPSRRRSRMTRPFTAEPPTFGNEPPFTAEPPPFGNEPPFTAEPPPFGNEAPFTAAPPAQAPAAARAPTRGSPPPS